MFVIAMRGLVAIVVLLVAVAAMRHEPFRPLPTAPMPAVNVP
jgi:FlaG/FlaF family flagellin (archaellin)